jgi:hypothetical protein
MEVPTMPDLHTTYLGLSLRSPLVASAGPFTGQLDRLVELELAGAGAVVLPSIFEEQIEHETTEIDRLYTVHGDSFHEATSFFPEVDDYGSAIDSYLELIENAKVAVDIPVIASLNGVNIGGWVKWRRTRRSPDRRSRPSIWNWWRWWPRRWTFRSPSRSRRSTRRCRRSSSDSSTRERPAW